MKRRKDQCRKKKTGRGQENFNKKGGEGEQRYQIQIANVQVGKGPSELRRLQSGRGKRKLKGKTWKRRSTIGTGGEKHKSLTLDPKRRHYGNLYNRKGLLGYSGGGWGVNGG